MSQTEQPVSNTATLQCTSCGATLQFAPGTHHLQCMYCGAANEITDTDASPIVSYDYQQFISASYEGEAAQTARVVSCKNCGASTTLPSEINSDNCAFCA